MLLTSRLYVANEPFSQWFESVVTPHATSNDEAFEIFEVYGFHSSDINKSRKKVDCKPWMKAVALYLCQCNAQHSLAKEQVY